MTSKKLSLVFAAVGAAALANLAAQAPAAAQSYTPGPHPYAPPKQWGQNYNGMHVFIYAGLKTHFVGQHDYPQFLADWSKILETRGAVVDGALHAPSAEDLGAHRRPGHLQGRRRLPQPGRDQVLGDFVRRGGGIVSIHDSLCGPDPAAFAKLVGGGKKHGEVNYTLDAPEYTFIDKDNPIMKSMSGMTINDEAFFKMTWADHPKIHVLATTVIAPTKSAGTHAGEVVPQIWTYEHTLPGGQARARLCLDAGAHVRRTSPTRRSNRCCCGASPGRASIRSTN